jgi:hypothetical protein
MADVLPFKPPASKKARNRGHTLCRNGHHKWKIVTERKFDVKQGRLVTLFECSRCGEQKVKAI